MLTLLVIAGLVIAVIAVRRTNAHAVQLEILEREVRELRRLLGGASRPEEPPAIAAAEPWFKPAAPRPAEARSEVPPSPTREAEVPPPVPPVLPRAEEPREAPAPPPSSAPPPPTPPAPPAAGIDWERWFGVRAAAVLGGVALALAGLLFFKYSIEHGLIPPWVRVVTGVLVGIGAIAASELRLRERYAVTADALAGAGVVLLYASFWAASALYGLIGMTPGFVCMVAVTAACCALAWRHASLVIALLGLVGGFATPLLVSSGSDRPIGLFGYVLLLDLALLGLARRRRWPMLAMLSLAGTIFYQVLWIGVRMHAGQVGLALGILATFAALFAIAGQSAAPEEDFEWRVTQATAVLAPFAFVFYFAANARFHPSFHQLAGLLVLLSAAAAWLARVQGPPVLAVGAASASLAVLGAWVFARTAAGVPAWPLALWACVLAGVFHAFVEREPERADRDGPTPPALLAAGGLLVLLMIAAVQSPRMWPWIAGYAGLTALLVRHGGFAGRERLHLVAAVGLALALTTFRLTHETAPWFPSLTGQLAMLIAAAVAFQAAALVPRSRAAAREAERGAAVLALGLLVPLVYLPFTPAPPVVFLGGTLVLGLLAALASTRLGEGRWLLAAVAVTAFVQSGWTFEASPDWPAAALSHALLMEALAVVVFTAWPFLAVPRFRTDVFAWPAAALAGPAWFLALRQLFTLRFGDGAIGILPVGLGALTLAAVARARGIWAADDPRRTTGLAWFAAVALSFATVAIPLQLEREWITIGWALEGLAVVVLWTRLDNVGLKYFGLALLGAATVRLVANPAVFGYYPRPAWRIVNWLLYTYLVPAAAILGASGVLGRRELARARAWERETVYGHGWPVGSMAAGLAGLVLVFVWINLAIADWFATGETLVVSFERLPARDLTMSIAWAIYALLLLGAGMARRSIGLRWVSLGLLLVTIAKVFLYDLGELRDLYRVASLLGLAVSLIAVSLAYQRFVFRDRPIEMERS